VNATDSASIDLAPASDELLRRCKDGDPSAREALITRFMPLARRLARRYERTSEQMDDLVQVAYVGLVKAVDRFDPDRGVAFTSFAVPTILGELRRHFRDAGWAVHVPRGLQERTRDLAEAQRVLTTKTGRAPTVDDLAEHMELSREAVLDALLAAAAYDTDSFDVPRRSADGETGNLLELIGDEDPAIEGAEDKAAVFAALPQLPPREREVLFLRFGGDMTQTEIAQRIGVSQMQVSRLLARSLQRLRELSGESC
jgi:RNA polymerase sigma-B factor